MSDPVVGKRGNNMILVSFLVLVVSIALLVVGLVRQSAVIIWAAIGTAALSAVLLFIGSKLGSKAKTAPAPVPGGMPDPAIAGGSGAPPVDRTGEMPGGPPGPMPAWQPSETPPPPVGLPGGSSPWAPPETERPDMAVDDDVASQSAPTVYSAETMGEPEPAAEPQEVAAAPGLPIDAYDSLSVSAIVPKLSGLSYEDLGTVRDYEVSKAGRKTLLARLDVMLRAAGPPVLEPAPAEAEGDADAEPKAQPGSGDGAPLQGAMPPPGALPPLPELEPIREAVVDEQAVETSGSPAEAVEALPVPGFGAMKVTDAQKALVGLDADGLLTMWEFESTNGARKSVLARIEQLYLKTGDMPIDGYDGAAVGSVKPLLSELLSPELRAVRAYEEANANRKSVIAEIDKLLERSSS